jgi:kynurenine formamidase
MCLVETADAVRRHHVHENDDEHDQDQGHDHVPVERVDRRRFLTGGGALAAGAALVVAAPALPAVGAPLRHPRSGRRMVDMTHRLLKSFPTFTGDQPSDEVVADFDTAGFYAKRWTIGEHTGTHIDTPGHFAEGQRLVDDMNPAELLAPVVVIDITRKAADDPNATVDPEDLVRFERRHGRIPDRALVCMNSGWAAKAGDPAAFLGGPAFPQYNFPGFSVDATDWLLRRRNPVGIGVDTVSLDPGNSTTFDVHVDFLAADRYGVEALANLDQIPPRGAETFVGPIPWEDGSGSPCRVLATW